MPLFISNEKCPVRLVFISKSGGGLARCVCASYRTCRRVRGRVGPGVSLRPVAEELVCRINVFAFSGLILLDEPLSLSLLWRQKHAAEL